MFVRPGRDATTALAAFPRVAVRDHNMAVNKVFACGSAVQQQPDGRYELTSWYRLVNGKFHDEKVSDLSWTEVCDCLLTIMDGQRPGWEVGDGWRQPDLESELDWPWPQVKVVRSDDC